MTNFEYIKSLNEENLAYWLIQDTLVEDWDEDYDGEIYTYTRDITLSANGIECWDYEEALEETLKWFKEEHNDE